MKPIKKTPAPQTLAHRADGAVKREFMAHPFFWMAMVGVAHAAVLVNALDTGSLLEPLVRLSLLWSVMAFMLAWVYRKLAAHFRGEDLDMQTWIMTKRVIPLRIASLLLCLPYVIHLFVR